MTQITVEALRGFEHDGSRRRGQRFAVSAPVAEQLRIKKLVRILENRMPGNPSTAAGTPPSASPVARASPPTTAKKSGRGGKQAAKMQATEAVPSSLPTPLSSSAPGPMSSTPSTEPGGTLI